VRRPLASAARFALCAALLAGASCAPAKRPPPPPREITLWAPWSAEVLAPALAGFELEHPGLRVHVTTMPDSARARRIAAAAPGDLPDLCAVGTGDMAELLAGGRLADWSAGVADLRDDLSGWEGCSVGDAIYGLPWLVAPRVLYWSPALFARAGLDGRTPPATWGVLERAAARVQRLGHGVHGYGVATGPGALENGILPLVVAGGGRILSENGRRAVFDSSGNVRALELLVRLRRAGLAAGQDSLEREFAAGRLGMLIAGPRLASAMARTGSARFGVAVVPASSDSTGGSWADGEVLVSFNGTRYGRRHDALDLARALVDRARADAVARRIGTLVPAAAADRRGLAATTIADSAHAVFIRQLAGCRFAPVHRAWYAMRDSLAAALDPALRGRRAPDRAVADAQARLEELLR
jgi:ABC-type glycerol-3-phosphate transport system substrate-binding protein